MRFLRYFVLVAAILLIFSVSLSFAQRERGERGWQGSGGWGTGSQYQRLYNPATVETISGTVVSVDRFVPLKGMSYGLHINVKTDKETIAVHLGPVWYMERQDLKIEVGDIVEIKGSRVTIGDKLSILAAEVKKGEDILVLRDSAGIPAWAAWRRR